MQKRIYRSRREKVFAGVAGGLAEYFEVDPVFIRLIFILLTFLSGIGIIGYIACIFLIPKESLVAATGNTEAKVSVDRAQEESDEKAGNKRKVIGTILIALGGLILLGNFIPNLDFDEIGPVLMILLGGWLIYSSVEK